MRKSALDLVGMVRALLSNAPQSTFSDEAIAAVATEVLNYIAATRRPNELYDLRQVTGVPGQSIYPIDDDIARVIDVFVDGVRLKEAAISDVLKLEETYDQAGTPAFWTMWSPGATAPYPQQIRVIPAPDAAVEIRLAVIKAHPPLVLEPIPTPVLVGPGHFLAVCELVAEKMLLQIAPQEAAAFKASSGGQVEDQNVYQRRSRSVGSLRVRVGGAIVPRSRRRSSW